MIMNREAIIGIKADTRRCITDARAKAADLPKGRETALVFTKLDEAEMWLSAIPTDAPVKP